MLSPLFVYLRRRNDTDPRGSATSCAGVRDGDHLGDAGGDWRGRCIEHRDGTHDTVDLRPLVDVLGPGLRDPVPAAADGGAFQGLLQHLRQSVSVHNRLPGAHQRRRAGDGSAGADSLSGIRRRVADAAVPVQNVGDAAVTDHSGGCVVRHAGRLPDRSTRAGLRRL